MDANQLSPGATPTPPMVSSPVKPGWSRRKKIVLGTVVLLVLMVVFPKSYAVDAGDTQRRPPKFCVGYDSWESGCHGGVSAKMGSDLFGYTLWEGPRPNYQVSDLADACALESFQSDLVVWHACYGVPILLQ